jgi:lysozyme
MNFEKSEALINKFESCKLTAYKDIVGVWTIGWGTTGHDIISGLTISQALADEWRDHRIAVIYSSLFHFIPTTYQTENIMNALIDFCYNCGIGNFQKSTLLKKLQGSYSKDDIASEFLRWNRAGGNVIDGLTRRREEEKALFLTI